MSEFRTELDAELRALDITAAPVEEAMRAGRRVRLRRRLGVAASVIAVVAIAAGVPALTHAGAAPALQPVTRRHSDLVITDTPPGRGAPAGEIAQGKIGAKTWRVTVSRSAGDPKGTYDIAFSGTVAGSRGSEVSGPLEASSGPASFESGQITGGAAATIGSAATDVAYFVLTFTDGQQLKLVPVTVDGYRLVAFVAPVSMTIAGITAHLGVAGHDNGQTETAIPFSVPGEMPVVGLWQRPGQAAPPRATRVLASGTADGKPWSLTAYEGPWGTCFVSRQAVTLGSGCEDSARLATTEVIGGWGGSGTASGAAYGSAAPGVAYVAVKLDNGKTVTAVPVTIGNERLFAFLVGPGVSPTRWTAYSASGKVLRTGSV